LGKCLDLLGIFESHPAGAWHVLLKHFTHKKAAHQNILEAALL